MNTTTDTKTLVFPAMGRTEGYAWAAARKVYPMSDGYDWDLLPDDTFIVRVPDGMMEEAERKAPYLRAILDYDFPTYHGEPSDYGMDVLYGRRALSGADLRGRAKHYGASYATTRSKVVQAAIPYGFHVRRDQSQNGLLCFVHGEPPADAVEDACAAGPCWVY